MKRTSALLAVALAVAACEQTMVRQPKIGPQSASKAFAPMSASRPLPAGTVERGDLEREQARSSPPPVTTALLARGRERFDIFCSPCHGAAGYGDGMIVQRGFRKPPSYHDPRLLAAPGVHFYDVIGNGFGAMYSYGAMVAPQDRWAIVSYVRALQLSQSASLAGDVP